MYLTLLARFRPKVQMTVREGRNLARVIIILREPLRESFGEGRTHFRRFRRHFYSISPKRISNTPLGGDGVSIASLQNVSPTRLSAETAFR